jgi:hypothetical protein
MAPTGDRTGRRSKAGLISISMLAQKRPSAMTTSRSSMTGRRSTSRPTSAVRVLFQRVLDDRAQPIDSLAHVHQGRREVDVNARRQFATTRSPVRGDRLRSWALRRAPESGNRPAITVVTSGAKSSLQTFDSRDRQKRVDVRDHFVPCSLAHRRDCSPDAGDRDIRWPHVLAAATA